MICTPRDYQQTAIDFLMDRLFVQDLPGAGLFLDPGLGKTLISLCVADKLTKYRALDGPILIVAPLRPVYSVWPPEIAKWKCGLKLSIVHGTPNQRYKALVGTRADIYITNPHNVDWLLRQQHRPDFGLLIIDESTFFKTWMAGWTRSMRKLIVRNEKQGIRGIPKRVILTGTPAANAYADLHSQIYILDEGERLGRTKTVFTDRFMRQNRYNKWEMKESIKGENGELLDPKELIAEAISDIVLEMKCEDYLDMPPLVFNNILIDLDEKVMKRYRKLERELFMLLDSGETLTATNAGAKYQLCRSVANGAVYKHRELVGKDEDLRDDETKRVKKKGVYFGRSSEIVHTKKVDALQELVRELNGKPLLVAYQFDHDLAMALKAFPKAPFIKGGTKPADVERIKNDWNASKIPVLFVQPQSMSHGLNMQDAGSEFEDNTNDICFWGLPNKPDVYQQFFRRRYRSGVKGTVRVHHLLINRTVDLPILETLQRKDADEMALFKAIEKYRKDKS